MHVLSMWLSILICLLSYGYIAFCSLVYFLPVCTCLLCEVDMLLLFQMVTLLHVDDTYSSCSLLTSGRLCLHSNTLEEAVTSGSPPTQVTVTT